VGKFKAGAQTTNAAPNDDYAFATHILAIVFASPCAFHFGRRETRKHRF
jgi:hypothetical protein